MAEARGPLGVGVIGAGGWSEDAHLPAFAACERARLVAICDVDRARAQALAERFAVPRVYTDPAALLRDPDVELVDVCTSTDTHARVATAAIDAGRHVLCEKPVAPDAAQTRTLARRADERGVRTKVAYTFRYAPAVLRLGELLADGALGEVFHVHGLEQNPQFLDPETPIRQVPDDDGSGALLPSSVVEYGSHLVNLLVACGGEVRSVVASMASFVPLRRLRGHEGLQRWPIEDATVALVEFASGAHGMLQTSHVAVGAGPGVELRVYGSRGAAVARLVAEGGRSETLHLARADDPTFRLVELPATEYPRRDRPGARPSQRYVAGLVRAFVDEVLDDGGRTCDFHESAASQRLVDALVRSHRARAWVDVEA